MKCDDCGGPAKPLFTGKYCVRECDLKPVESVLTVDSGGWTFTIKHVYLPAPSNVIAVLPERYKCTQCGQHSHWTLDAVAGGQRCTRVVIPAVPVPGGTVPCNGILLIDPP